MDRLPIHVDQFSNPFSFYKALLSTFVGERKRSGSEGYFVIFQINSRQQQQT